MEKRVTEYFERIRELAAEDYSRVGRGVQAALEAYSFTINRQSSEFECNDLPWTTNMVDFVKALREAGLETIVVTETSTALLENLHKLAAQGCTVEGLCTVTRPDFWCKPEDVPGIRVRISGAE